MPIKQCPLVSPSAHKAVTFSLRCVVSSPTLAVCELSSSPFFFNNSVACFLMLANLLCTCSTSLACKHQDSTNPWPTFSRFTHLLCTCSTSLACKHQDSTNPWPTSSRFTHLLCTCSTSLACKHQDSTNPWPTSSRLPILCAPAPPPWPANIKIQQIRGLLPHVLPIFCAPAPPPRPASNPKGTHAPASWRQDFR